MATKQAKTNRLKTKPTGEKPKLVNKVVRDAEAVSQFGRRRASGFIDFVRQQGVVGLAVGLAIGTAAGAAVKTLVTGFINPIVGFMIGGIDLTKLVWKVVAPSKHGTGGLVIQWGAILSSIITLFATALVIYWIVHVARLDRVDKPKE